MRGIPALRAIVAAIVAVCVGVLASGALAAPSAIPQPTPPPGGGGGSSSGGGGGGSSRPTVRRPVGPVAVGNGKAGAVLLEATGERTKEPATATTATPPVTTTPPPATTAEAPATTAVAPATTAAAPATTAQAPGTTAEVAPPATTAPQPAAGASSGDGGDSGTPTLPRDGIVVLVGVLLLGLGVALRAIRSRERRIGWALLGFCIIYLLALAGLVTGVAGAATANPGAFGATAGDGETLLTFDAPPAGLELAVRRVAGSVPPATCSTGTPVTIAAPDSGSQVDGPLPNGTRVSYRACLVDGSVASSGATASATPVSGLDRVAPRAVAGLVARRLGGRVALTWRNPSDRDYAETVVVRKLGSEPTSPTDGKVVYAGDRPSLLDYPFSLIPVHYAVFAVDENGNAATPVRTALPSFDPPLRTPLDRSSMTARKPRFTWKPVAAADHYNVQVYLANRCCRPRDVLVNSYPTTASLTAPKRLDRGTYVWYVFAHVKPGNAVTSYRALNTIGWRFTVK